MLIACPSCATSYAVDVASLRPNGRKVRCVRCHTVWRPELNQAARLLAAANDIAPEAPVPPADPPTPAPGGASADDTQWREALAEGLPPPPASAGSSDLAPADVAPEAVDSPTEDLAVEAPPLAPEEGGAGSQSRETVDAVVGDDEEEAAVAEAPVVDVESYAARSWRGRSFRVSLRWPLTHLQNGILALLIVDAVLIAWRTDVVRLLPQTASFYAMMGLAVNVRGLAFEGITTTTEQHEGVPILVVEGSVVNQTNRLLEVPRLRFALRNSGREEIYTWTVVPPRASAAPGESVAFRTRLASPPVDGRDVLVRFLTRHDIIAGAR